MHSDNPRLPNISTRPISLGLDKLRKLPVIAFLADRFSQDGVGIQPVQADLTCLLTVAKNKRRRDALDILASSEGGEMSLRDLANGVASREYDKPVGALTGKERTRVYIGFKQCHVGRLEDAGLIESGEDDTPITATRDTARAVEMIDELEAVTGGGL